MLIRCIVIVFVILVALPMLLDSQGTWCARRPGRKQGQQCCFGRDDYCTVPIADTLCYCDEFCNRTIHDCCPDFWKYCLGIQPPPGSLTPPPITSMCTDQGKQYQSNAVIRKNCNTCTCIKDPYDHKMFRWSCTDDPCVIRPEMINRVNIQSDAGWMASNYSFLWGKKLTEALKYRLGTFPPAHSVMKMTPLKMKPGFMADSFDARRQWPGMVHEVMDQGDCGASWAFSTTGVAADRLTIHSHGGIKDLPSPQQLLSCNTRRQRGCEGGHLDRAWWYLRKIGVVSDACYPYTSGYDNSGGQCMVPKSEMIKQHVMCPRSRRMTRSVYKTTPPYRIRASEMEIMKEIEENGPVQATFLVKEDFYMYRNGVYRYMNLASKDPQKYRAMGWHSVKIIGWGVDRSTGKPIKYWLCANSWGPRWGENGYFKIIRGQNECQIESFVVGVWGKVNGMQVLKDRRTKRRLRHLRHMRKLRRRRRLRK